MANVRKTNFSTIIQKSVTSPNTCCCITLRNLSVMRYFIYVGQNNIHVHIRFRFRMNSQYFCYYTCSKCIKDCYLHHSADSSRLPPTQLLGVTQRKLRKLTANWTFDVFFFSERVINRWNQLDQEAVNSGTVNSFKNNLERIRKSKIGFFMDHPVR